MYSSSRGFSLVELLVTLSVMGIIIAYATPALYHFYANNRLWLYTHQFTQTLAFARSEAIKRNSEILICPIDHDQQCSKDNNWNKPWMVFEDFNDNGKKEQNEPLLRRLNFDDTAVSIRSNRKPKVRYFSNGKSTGSNASFRFCDSRGEEFARTVILSNSGRFRITDRKNNGKKRSC